MSFADLKEYRRRRRNLEQAEALITKLVLVALQHGAGAEVEELLARDELEYRARLASESKKPAA